MFIASVLAAAWTVATVVTYLRARHSALFVALVDLAFVGTFIAAVYELRGIAGANCSNFSSGSIYVSLGPFGYYGRTSDSPWAANINKNCAMLKACFALGIMNCIFFFVTFVSGIGTKLREKEKLLTLRQSYSLSLYTDTTRTRTESLSSASITHRVTPTDDRAGALTTAGAAHHVARIKALVVTMSSSEPQTWTPTLTIVLLT